jgi:uncharacterized membrane protein (DUF441 family)
MKRTAPPAAADMTTESKRRSLTETMRTIAAEHKVIWGICLMTVAVALPPIISGKAFS